MSVTMPQAAVGDIILDAVNALADTAEAAINNADGADLQAASVATSKLAKPKALLCVPFGYDGDLAVLAADRTLKQTMLPNIDGAVNGTWVYLGMSLSTVQQVATAGRSIVVSEDGVTKQTISLDNTTYHATGVSVLLGSPVTTASGKLWKVQFTYGGANALTGVEGDLWFSLNHVGT